MEIKGAWVFFRPVAQARPVLSRGEQGKEQHRPADCGMERYRVTRVKHLLHAIMVRIDSQESGGADMFSDEILLN